MLEKYDSLKNIRNLPSDIIKDIPSLLVNRVGNHPHSYMITEDFIGYVENSKIYTLTFDGLKPAPKDSKVAQMAKPKQPPFSVLIGNWIEKIDLNTKDGNILGGNGRYTLKDNEEVLEIKIADCSREHLAWYNSYLAEVGENLRFRTEISLPVTITTIGETYPDYYLLDAKKGGGAYLEFHDRLHFHMPLEIDAKGYLVIGKVLENGTKVVSAFQIPYGYGIYMSPWAIHTDSFLVGRYMVIYSVTSKFSTVIIRKKNGHLAPIRFVKQKAI